METVQDQSRQEFQMWFLYLVLYNCEPVIDRLCAFISPSITRLFQLSEHSPNFVYTKYNDIYKSNCKTPCKYQIIFPSAEAKESFRKRMNSKASSASVELNKMKTEEKSYQIWQFQSCLRVYLEQNGKYILTYIKCFFPLQCSGYAHWPPKSDQLGL